ncbi:POTRA domain-containing protein [Sphingomonas sp. LR60]|uniref:ShlB/FhaC/HecB family hemolysin secretion/activation protein n=1 Tax=Sphingomonas sp. LR60 TaxID=3050233 RepID=UPI002FDF7102
MKRLAHAACLTGTLLLATEASAQVAPLPAQVDPGRVQQQLAPPPLPRTAPEIVTPEIPETVAPEAAANVRLTVRDIRVEGSTVYPAGAFDDLIRPLLGREITLTDAFRLADAITARYRSDDYVLSRVIVPAQRVEDGVLRLQVVEGFVSKVEVQGKASRVLRRYADALVASRPLRGKVLERYLLLMNDLAGVDARAVLAPAPDVAGGSLVTIVATHKAIDAYAGMDNHGSRYIGPIQYYGGVATNDALGLGERIALNYAGAAPASELQYVNGQIDLPLGGDGLLLTTSAGYSHSRPGFVLKPLNARADGTTLGARLGYPLLRSRAQTVRVGLAFHYLDSRTVINDAPDLTPSSYDRIRALRLNASYDVADHAGGRTCWSSNIARACRCSAA